MSSSSSQQEDNDVIDWTPLYMSVIAGASTCLGAAVVFCHPKSSDGTRTVSANTMSFSLALAASVMVTVSVISLGPECLQKTDVDDDASFELMPLWSYQFLQRVVFFGLGGGLYFGLSWFAFPEPDEVLGLEKQPEEEVGSLVVVKGKKKPPIFVNEQNAITTKSVDPPNMRSRRQKETDSYLVEDQQQSSSADIETNNNKNYISKKCDEIHKKFWTGGGSNLNKDQHRAWRTAMILFVSLLCHNFPEGLAVVASALESRKLGMTVTVGIMIHNIPEGIAIAIPCLAARPESPWLSFALASLSGLAEPAGAFFALLFLRKVKDDDATVWNMENVLAFVAGVMITVAVYELFPEAKRHTKTHGKKHFIAGTVIGIIIMVATELYI